METGLHQGMIWHCLVSQMRVSQWFFLDVRWNRFPPLAPNSSCNSAPKKKLKSFCRKLISLFFFCVCVLSSLLFSLSNYSNSFRGGDSTMDRLVLTPTPTKRALMLRWVDWKLSLAATRSPGSSSRARTANTAGKKKREKKEEEYNEKRVREERQKERLLGCYSLSRSPSLQWSHLLKRRSAVQTLKHDPSSGSIINRRILILQKASETNWTPNWTRTV